MKPSLSYLFFTFLRIGATSWGGFMALISMVQKTVVEKDQKIANETILEGISLASVLPGPMAVNVVSFIGYKLNGVRGALVSIAGILLPSFILMLILTHFYLKYGDLPTLNHFFSGVLPAVAAIIISVAVSMSKQNIKDQQQIYIAIVSAVIITFSKSYLTTLAVLIVSGVIGYIYYKRAESSDQKVAVEQRGKTDRKNLLPVIISGVVLVLLFSLLPIIASKKGALFQLHQQIFLTFAGMSLSQFGGGYVIIPTMQKIIVDGLHWLSEKEFVDAIAMGQITPGPIFISATFIGYKLGGFWGAINATLSIFLPTGFLTMICTRFLDKINKSVTIGYVFKGLRPAIIGMIVSAGISIMISHEITLFAVSVFGIVLVLLIRFKLDPVYLIPAAGIAGLLLL